MNNLKLTTVPDPVLLKKWEHKPTKQEARSVGMEMLQLMEKNNGVGLAAQQVGLLWNMFVFNPTGKAEDGNIVCNPKIFGREEYGQVVVEGCLSIPGVQLPIVRHKIIHATWYDENAKKIVKTLTDMESRIFAHEFDHLNGVLISDLHTMQQGDPFLV